MTKKRGRFYARLKRIRMAAFKQWRIRKARFDRAMAKFRKAITDTFFEENPFTKYLKNKGHVVEVTDATA